MCNLGNRLMTGSMAAVLALLMGLAATASSPAKLVPVMPDQGKDPSDFVPTGWRIFKHASGTLTENGGKDYAMILTEEGDNPEAGYTESGFAKYPRPLVILHADANGAWKKACVSPGAVMNGSLANDFALLAVDVKIQKNNVIVSNGNGATLGESFDCTYRLRDGKYEMIGFTDSGGNTREGSSFCNDSNLITGYTIMQEEIDDISTGAATHQSKYSFYNLRAGLSQSTPLLNGFYTKEKYPGPCVELKRAVNVAVGGTIWHSPADLSAELHAVHTKSDLFICASITHRGGTKAPYMRLVAGKKYIAPAQVVDKSVGDIDVIEARFPLSSLPVQDAGTTERIQLDYKLVEASIQIVEPAQSGSPSMIISTSCDRERHHGVVHLTKSAELPTLETWDWQHPEP